MLGKTQRKGILDKPLVGIQISPAIMELNIETPSKTKIGSTLRPGDTISEYNQNIPCQHITEISTYQHVQSRYLLAMMDKENTVQHIDTHTHIGILFSHKRNRARSFVRKWVKLKIILSSELNQTQKDKYHLFFSLTDPRGR